MPSGSIIVGRFTVGLLILPIVIISAQEAVASVLDSQRRASYAMGAIRWQTVCNVVLPASLHSILTGTILALGRAIGDGLITLLAVMLSMNAAAILVRTSTSTGSRSNPLGRPRYFP